MDTDNQLGTVHGPDVYSIPEAAARLGTDYMTVMRLADDGTLEDRYVGRRRFVTRATVDALPKFAQAAS